MDFYFFHQWLYRLSERRKYLYMVFMVYVVFFTILIGTGIMFGIPIYLGYCVNLWLGLSALITVPFGMLFYCFIFDLFNF